VVGEDVFDLGCDGVELPGSNEVFDGCVMLDECFLFERDNGLRLDADEEMLIRLFLPQDSHL
jgi:hypothetical protein